MAGKLSFRGQGRHRRAKLLGLKRRGLNFPGFLDERLNRYLGLFSTLGLKLGNARSNPFIPVQTG